MPKGSTGSVGALLKLALAGQGDRAGRGQDMSRTNTEQGTRRAEVHQRRFVKLKWQEQNKEYVKITGIA